MQSSGGTGISALVRSLKGYPGVLGKEEKRLNDQYAKHTEQGRDTATKSSFRKCKDARHLLEEQ